MTYLDNAATTLIKPAAVPAAMKRAASKLASPGRGGHKPSMRAAQTAFRCREAAAGLFGVSNPERVVFTMNATHALNIAINSLVSPGLKVAVSGYEHNSVTRPLYGRGADIIIVRTPLFNSAAVLDGFRRAIGAGARVVVCTQMSNVFGFILPVEELAGLCAERGIPLIIDASQSAGSVKTDFDALGAAFLAAPGHKGLYGPQGTGLLLCGDRARPLLMGGTGSNSALMDMPDFLPDMLEAGTHNMPGIAGLEAGLGFVGKRGEAAIMEHERKLIGVAADKLSGIGGVRVFYSDKEGVQGGVLSFTLDSMPSEAVAGKLAAMGIAVRAGLHCAPEAHRTAGTFDTGAVRVSVSAFNRKTDIFQLAEGVKRIAVEKKTNCF